MQIFKIGGEYIIVKSVKTPELRFREILSKLILSKYGEAPYPTDNITEILFFCRDYYILEFEKMLSNENSYSFYKKKVWLHEQAANLRRSEYFNNLPEGVSKSYIGVYRRILKMIIEQGCCTDMVTGEKRDSKFKNRIHLILNKLLFLGEMLIVISELIAEQGMIEEAVDLSFDNNNLLVFGRKHHYQFILNHIGYKQENENPDYIIDENGRTDFEKAILNSFGLEYAKFEYVIKLVMYYFKFKDGDCISVEQSGFLKDIEQETGTPIDSVKKFMSGMTLTKENKLPLFDLLKKPHSLNKYRYRPFLLWTINQKKYYVFGTASLNETKINLYFDAIPFGKIPEEWTNISSFTQYVNRKEDKHDKWLEDNIENSIKAAGLFYQRNVEKLVVEKQQSYSLVKNGPGEIDFLIVSHNTKKILVADCKHLLGRYEMVNQRNDYDHFTIDKKKHKSYNTRMNLKTQWLIKNKSVLEKHLQLRFKESTLSLKDYTIEGIFFINTPTFYMYNSDLRIYTFEQVADVLTGKHIDPVFRYVIEEENKTILYSIKYPYFRKPTVLYYEDEDDDYEVDKYGEPIKPMK